MGVAWFVPLFADEENETCKGQGTCPAMQLAGGTTGCVSMAGSLARSSCV